MIGKLTVSTEGDLQNFQYGMSMIDSFIFVIIAEWWFRKTTSCDQYDYVSV